MVINSHVHLESFINLENNKLIIDENYFNINENSNLAIKIENLKLSTLILKI